MSPTAYLKEHGLEMWKIDDRRVLFKEGEGPKGTAIGEYNGFDATNRGLRDVSAAQVLEEYIKPIVEKYENVV